jgi:hypothetical protein
MGTLNASVKRSLDTAESGRGSGTKPTSNQSTPLDGDLVVAPESTPLSATRFDKCPVWSSSPRLRVTRLSGLPAALRRDTW